MCFWKTLLLQTITLYCALTGDYALGWIMKAQQWVGGSDKLQVWRTDGAETYPMDSDRGVNLWVENPVNTCDEYLFDFASRNILHLQFLYDPLYSNTKFGLNFFRFKFDCFKALVDNN